MNMITELLRREIEGMMQYAFADEWNVAIEDGENLVFQYSGYKETEFKILWDSDDEIYRVTGKEVAMDILQQIFKFLSC